MRRLSLTSVVVLAAVSLPGPAFALVPPRQGNVLIDYDIRVDGVPRSSPSSSDARLVSDASGSGRPTMAIEPGAAQLAVVERLRRDVSPSLVVNFLPANALPHQLHAYGTALSAPSAAPAVTIARDFLKANRDLFRLSSAEIDALVVARDYATHDVFRTVWLAQQIGGVMVDQAAVRFGIDASGRVIWVSAGRLEPGARVDAVARISPEEAIMAAARHIGVRLESAPRSKTTLGSNRLVFERGPFLQDVTVEPAIFPMGGGAILAWRVSLEPSGEMPTWYHVTVDARAGRLLKRYNLYQYATNAGLVFDGPYPNDPPPSTNFPDGVAQSQQSFGYRWPSTVGWTIPAPYGTYNLSTGNNVEAKEDWSRDNETTVGLFADGGPQQEFFAPFTNAYRTSVGTTHAARIAAHKLDVSAVTTNLFFWINSWHDYMHALGFNEASGNFQRDNFSRGGCGFDSILADAMDGAAPPTGAPSLNNANFGTPPEALPGTCTTNTARPRMQQFVVAFGAEAAPTWLADTSLDAHVIIHEFSHGTSNRLVGGPFAGCMGGTQAGGMGEGFGDWYAASRFDDPLVGRWSFNGGLRMFPMDMNPRTYADLVDQVHSDGEIYASTLWDMRAVVGRAVAEQLLTDGMKLAPCGPSFLNMRDAILMADQLRYGGANRCAIWAAHLARGMGFEALGANSTYAVPDFLFNAPICSGAAHLRYRVHTTSDVIGGNGDGLYSAGEIIDLNVELQNFDGAATATAIMATVSSSTPGVTMVSPNRTYPNINIGGSSNPALPFQFRIDPGFVCGAPIDFDIAINWAPTLSRVASFQDTSGSTSGIALVSNDAEGTALPVTAPVAVVNTRNHTPTGANSYWMLSGCYAGDEVACDGLSPCNDTCGTITLPALSLPLTQAAWVSFWATYNVEYTWDGPYVEVSTDGGTTWTPLATLNYPSIITGQANGCFPATDVGGINGPMDNMSFVPWTRYAGNLAAYVGQTISLRIVNHQDGCVVFEGAYIDDLAVEVQNCRSGPFVSVYMGNKANLDGANPGCTDIDGLPDPGESIDVTIPLTNSGNTTANNLMATLTSTNPNITVNIATATQNYGNVASGQSASASFRYSVAMTGVGCFEPADFNLAVTANGGSFTDNLAFTETLRSDTAIGSWTDDFEGTKPAWTASLGPAGTANDWSLRELDCLTGAGNRFFWATNIGMNQAVCSTGEPDYSPDSDSVLTSPPIDLGNPGMKLTALTWDSFAVPNTVQAPGFVEVLIDHDGDGIFTPLVNAPLGIGSGAPGFVVDIQNNPLAAPILPAVTTQMVRLQFRFRSGPNPDPGGTADSIGMIINDLQLSWERCDVNACAPGIQGPTTRVRGGMATAVANPQRPATEVGLSTP